MDGTLVSLYEGDGSEAGARMESRNGKAQRLVFLAFGLCCELFLPALTLVFTLWYPTSTLGGSDKSSTQEGYQFCI